MHLYIGLSIPWSSYTQTLGTCVHEKEALEDTVLQLRVSDVLGIPENGVLVGYKTRLKWITLNVNANHIRYGVCRGLWNTREGSCYHWSYPPREHLFIATAPNSDTISCHLERQIQSWRKILPLAKSRNSVSHTLCDLASWLGFGNLKYLRYPPTVWETSKNTTVLYSRASVCPPSLIAHWAGKAASESHRWGQSLASAGQCSVQTWHPYSGEAWGRRWPV